MKRSQEIQIDKVIPILKAMGQNIGIPCSISRTEHLLEQVKEEWSETDSRIKDLTGFYDTIDYTSRTSSRNHYAVLAGEFLYNDSTKFYGKMNNSGRYSISLTKPKLESMANYMHGDKKELVTLLINMSSLNNLLSSTQSHLNTLRLERMTRTDSQDEDIVWVRTNYSMGKTGRILNDNISIQGMSPKLRETITAPKGYRIVSCDIKAQEVVICINAVFTDTELKRLYCEENDCYRALLRRLGFEISKETRNLAKIPILGKIRGMSDNTVRRDMGEANKEMADAMLNYINTEPGMISLINTARKEASSPTPRLRGLFKSIYPLVLTEAELRKSSREQYESKVRKILSAAFQTTAAELLSYSLGRVFLRQVNGELPTGKDFMPIGVIHDEVVFMVREDIVDEMVKVIEEEFLVQVSGWTPFAGETNVGVHYESK